MESSQTPEESRVIKCPFCPKCGTPAAFIAPLFLQTWCTNEDCDVFMWVPWDTAEENLSDVGQIAWEEHGKQD